MPDFFVTGPEFRWKGYLNSVNVIVKYAFTSIDMEACMQSDFGEMIGESEMNLRILLAIKK